MTRHIKELDGVRGLLALWVVLTHVCYLSGFRGLTSALHANVAVELFMILSGFVIFNLLDRGETYADFITRRFFRLFPVFLLGLGFSVLLGEFLLPPDTEVFLRTFYVKNNQALAPYLFSHLTLLHGAIPDQELPGSSVAYLPPAWSISLEWQFYLLAPFLFAYLKRPDLRVALLVLLLFLVRVAHGAQEHGLPFLPHLSFGYFNAFLPLKIELFFVGGSCFFAWKYLSSREIPLTLRSDWLTPLLMPLAFFLTHSLSIAVWSALFLLLVAFRSGQQDLLAQATCRALGLRPLQWLGMVSYSLYVLHWPVLVLTRYAIARTFPELGAHAQAALLGGIGPLLSVGLAGLIFPLIEKPCMDYARRLTRRNARAPSVDLSVG